MSFLILGGLAVAAGIWLVAGRRTGKKGRTMTRTSWYLLMNGLVGFWLVTAGVVVVAHRFLSTGIWLMVHLLLLGAVSTAILIWSQHFADTLLRRAAPGGRISHGIRLLGHTVGAATVVVGIVAGWWPLVVTGGAIVAVVAIAHATSLIVQSRGALPARFAPLVHYYIAASLTLVVGVGIGIVMSRADLPAGLHDRLYPAHIGFNLLGWVGLTVVGTVVLFWPTVLHTRVSETADATARRALGLLLAGLLLYGLACLFDLRVGVALAVLVYLVGLGQVFVDVIRQARRSSPSSFAGWSIGAALGWFAGCTLGLGVLVATASNWADAGDRLAWLVVPFAVGFAAQILLGALSYLLPVVLGGGPKASRRSAAELDRGGLFRVVVVNVGLVLYLLPTPNQVKATVSFVVFGVLLAFLVLAVRAIQAARVASK
ncbi:MAG: hypothetical protein ACYCZY_06390 [Lacisediminihabitans sp.]